MPTNYLIDSERRLVQMRAWGVCTNADLRDVHHRLVEDPSFRADYRCVASIEAVTECKVDSCVIAEVASWPVFDVGTRRAFVATTDVGFGLARMFSMHAEAVGQNVQVFRSEREAMEWLESPVQAGTEPEFAPRVRRRRLSVA